MPEIALLSESELRQAVPLDLATIDCVASAFAALSGNTVVMPPILSMPIEEHHGEVDVKTAYIPGLDSFAIKMSPGFYDNPALGLPSTTGLMVLFSSRTGMVEALLLDNGYLTNVRTAAAGAVAAGHLARSDASSVCIVGAGAQGFLQLAALCLVRPIRSATLWARDHQKAELLATRASKELGLDVSANADREHSVRSADIIVTTTPATTPLIEADWLQPGQHVTAMGSDQPDKNELHPDCLAKAERYVADRLSQTRVLGELHHALEAGVITEDSALEELGDIVAGKITGRRTEQEITIADLTGTGAQDTAIATLARERAKVAGLGTPFISERTES